MAAEIWREVGAAWGEAAADWATLIEPWVTPMHAAVGEHLAIGERDRVVDVACGSALSLVEFARRGAKVAGIDASAALIDVARARLPDGDLRIGDFRALPWDDNTFTVATSFHGIWAGGDKVLREVRRVLVPGGRVAVGFWGNPKRMELVVTWGLALAEMMPADEFAAETALLDIGRPGVAEELLSTAGFVVSDRLTIPVTIEFPDLDVAVRAYSSPGPARIAIRHSGLDRWTERLRAAFEPFVDSAGAVRLRNEGVVVLADG